MDASKLEKEMSKKGPKDPLPPAKGKLIDAEAPQVKAKDAAAYKGVEEK